MVGSYRTLIIIAILLLALGIYYNFSFATDTRKIISHNAKITNDHTKLIMKLIRRKDTSF